jgi:hypothetical protein
MSVRNLLQLLAPHGIFAPICALGALGAFAHLNALLRLDLTDGRLPTGDQRNVIRASLVDYVNGHLWIVALFFLIWALTSLGLQSRRLPRWPLRTAFILFATPVLCYSWVCFGISNTPLFAR